MTPLRAYLIPFAVLLLIIAMGRARANGLPPGVTCDDVRAAVASVQKTAGVSRERAFAIVAAMATGQGATTVHLAEARRCLILNSK